MRTLIAAWATLAVASTAGAAFAQEPRNYKAEYDEAVQTAKTAARFEHLGLLNRLCVLPPSNAENTSDEPAAYITDPTRVPARDTWYMEPAQVFDDLYFVGGKVHSAWALQTSDGIILIDTIYPYNSEELIIDGMHKLGLDPADIKYVVISHAHGDHIGGVEIVQAASGAPVVMGAADWDLVTKYPKRFTAMTPDASTGIRVDEQMDLTLGDTTLQIFPTPGHTPGTLSYIFTVHDFGRPVTVAYAGGTAFNFPTASPDPGIPNLQAYMDSQEAFVATATEAGASVLISNHSEFDSASNKIRMMAGRGYGPHPFENGAESVADYFQVMKSCARAKQITLEEIRDKP